MQTLIFWQNIVSPHQLPYIKAIPRVCPAFNVILVVEQGMTSNRKAMGWVTEDVSETSRFNIIIAPSEEAMHGLFISYPEAQHFFSGIRSNPLIYNAFKISMGHEVKRHLIVEGPFLYTYSFFIHYVKTMFTDYKYYKYFDKVYAIGNHALNWYPKFGFKAHQIIPFSYCVEHIKTSVAIENKDEVKFLFVGGLSHRKGVDLLLKACRELGVGHYLDIIGDGVEREALEVYCKTHHLNQVRFLGTKNNNEIRNMLHEYDVHILPSRHDGWGAVINEALMAGLFVLCSTNCGAQELIQDKFNGIVFSYKKKKDLYNALLYCATHVAIIRAKKESILQWSRCIEGDVIADYFVSALESDTRITPPWHNFK
ncbi:glycosyltransferase family 4 protein [Lacinutrix undariae]